jgi:hypothetical protein
MRARKRKELHDAATETTIDGNSLTSDGKHRINPSDPNRLSGSYSKTFAQNVTETISWKLQKGGAPLRLLDLKFEDMKFPNWNDWQEITSRKAQLTATGSRSRRKSSTFQPIRSRAR